jgi:hypothetical protein
MKTRNVLEKDPIMSSSFDAELTEDVVPVVESRTPPAEPGEKRLARSTEGVRRGPAPRHGRLDVGPGLVAAA